MSQCLQKLKIGIRIKRCASLEASYQREPSTIVSKNQAVLLGGITMQKRDLGIFEQSWSQINQ